MESEWPFLCVLVQYVAPLLRVVSRLGLTVKEATLLIQMVEDMDPDLTNAITAPTILRYYGLHDAPDVIGQVSKSVTSGGIMISPI